MRRMSSVVLLGVLLAGLVTPVVAADPPGRPTLDRGLLEELRSAGASVERHLVTGYVRSVSGRAGRPAATRATLGDPSTAAEAADRFMRRYASIFGVADAAADLASIRTTSVSGGRTVVRLQQSHRRVPVLGADLRILVGPQLDVLAATGEASPNLTIDVTATLSEADAARAAISVTARASGLPAAALSASRPELWIYDPVLLGARGQPFTRLVWRTEASNAGGDIARFVLVDARAGAIALSFSQVRHIAPPEDGDQRICDQRNSRRDQELPCEPSDREVPPAPGASDHVDLRRAFEYSEATYDFYRLRFGRDSLDGAGMTMVTTVRWCPPPRGGSCPRYPNAFWEPSLLQVTYGSGAARADDLVAHELTHGVTQFESNLFYYAQSGAINEALSDIFGEYVDLDHHGSSTDGAAVRWQLGEDLGASGLPAPSRDMEDPTIFANPDRMRSFLYWSDPNEVDNLGVHTNSGVANKAAFLMTDGGTFNGQAITGLGIDKAAYLWYEVQTSYLGTASDYADLATALRSACALAQGVIPADKSGSESNGGPFTSGDCVQVERVLLATEMDFQPKPLGTAAPEAPVCTNGGPATAFFDDLDGAPSNWVVTADDPPGVWVHEEGYAHSDPRMFYGADVDVASDSALQMASPVAIPANAFLHFHHAYAFEDDSSYSVAGDERYDGGVIEYRSGSGPWRDAARFVTHNGYDGRISTDFDNPLGGRRAFTAESAGYTSTRLSLASLAGQDVAFRFRIGTDSSGGDLGWVVDDVRIFRCPTDTDGSPEVGAPRFRLERNVQLPTNGMVPIFVKIPVQDESGTSATALRQAIDGGAFTDVNVGTLGSTLVRRAVRPGGSTEWRFRAAAVDEAGNGDLDDFGPVGGPFRLRAFQDTKPTVTYTGSWSNESGAGFYGGSVHSMGDATSTARITATGTGFALVTTMGQDRGAVRIVIKEGATVVVDEVVDSFWSTELRRMVTFAWDFETSTSRTMEISQVDIGFGLFRVDLDAFLVTGA